MKKIVLLTLIACTLPLCSCGSKSLDLIPKTGFISHYEKDTPKHSPFLSFYLTPSKQALTGWDDGVTGKHGKRVNLYIYPVNISHVTNPPQTVKEQQALVALAQHFTQEINKQFSVADKKNPNFHLVSSPQNAYTLEVAITSATPNRVGEEVLKTGVGFITPITNLAATAVDKIETKSQISMAARVKAPDGHTFAEWADFHYNKGAITGVDFKKFSKYAQHRRQIDAWSREMMEEFITPVGSHVKKPSFIQSLNPF